MHSGDHRITIASLDMMRNHVQNAFLMINKVQEIWFCVIRLTQSIQTMNSFMFDVICSEFYLLYAHKLPTIAGNQFI